jgi:tetratricopeptide (TPR) repeat protein
MSKMLALIQAGWSSIRSSVEQGRRTDALNRLRRLLARPDVPAAVAADAHRLAGELLTDVERYSEARRHLRAAAALEPSIARTYYLWAAADERDASGCDRRAARRYGKACRLSPRNPLYRAAFGRAAVRCDRLGRGVKEMLAAADAAMGDLNVIRIVVEGLLEADRPGTALRVLNRVGFLCHEAEKSREFRVLVERVRFARARRDQRGERGTTRKRQDAVIATEGARVVLPFIRVTTEAKPRQGEIVRRDVVSLPRPHFPRLRSRKVDR